MQVTRMCFLCFKSSKGSPTSNPHILLCNYWVLSTGAFWWMLKRWGRWDIFLLIRKCSYLLIHEVQTVLQSINGKMDSFQVYWQVLRTWEGKWDTFLHSFQTEWLVGRRQGLQVYSSPLTVLFCPCSKLTSTHLTAVSWHGAQAAK